MLRPVFAGFVLLHSAWIMKFGKLTMLYTTSIQIHQFTCIARYPTSEIRPIVMENSQNSNQSDSNPNRSIHHYIVDQK